ncbi:unnamed protein product [Bemisia tabaci]|uniref:RRM domain-containing protein n=1 Tax=Bemisia tabaci TaxID=7038 RepID=A0A9P0A7X7_BEMTA|nr:unnamed protein product [Bemisia tabaci]
MSDQNVLDKSLRSVFVGNIPYEATEERLKEIFSEVGPVLSFKLVYDRETGKPKGYGFCEYKDQETALSAMRNLNGCEISGRSLRVDNACTEKSRLEMQSLMAGPQSESQYGEPVSAEKAPEAISKAVASLPPEQMFELMKQMKLCVQNNPAEARTMLLQNPQLAYALLQAQVVMRIVDAQVAVSMLHAANPPVTPLQIPSQPAPPLPGRPADHVNDQWTQPQPGSRPGQLPPPPAFMSQDLDLRTMDPRNRSGNSADQDLRMPPSMSGYPPANEYPPRMPAQRPAIPEPIPPPPSAPPERFPRDPRDPRAMASTNATNVGPVPAPARPPVPPAASSASQAPPRAVPPPAASNPDSEKTALIMQVLQLTNEQIAMLPPEQRQSILVLKEQIAKSTQQR